MEIKKIFLTENGCYKAARTMKPAGIVVHSTGANNPYLKRYIAPDDGMIGENEYGNHWNRTEATACMNAMIGKDKNDNVTVYQTLPYNYKPWGCGSGKSGSYNSTHIQFEVCEDDLTDQEYFSQAYEKAAEFCAFLSKEYDINIQNIVSHAEAHDAGYASNHADIDHWLTKFGKTMDDFRNDVKKLLNQGKEDTKEEEKKEEEEKEEPKETEEIKKTEQYKVTAKDGLRVRKGQGVKYGIIKAYPYGTIFEISHIEDGWGYGENTNGWSSMEYLEKVSKVTAPKYEPKAGDKVMVTGNLYSNTNGGNSEEKNSAAMYIYKIYSKGRYPIAFIKTKDGSVINGYGDVSVITEVL